MTKSISLFAASLFTLSLSFMPAQAADTIKLEPQAFQIQALNIEPISMNASQTEHETTLFGLPLNEGPIDRSIRAVIAAGLIGTGIYGLMNPTVISQPVSYTLLGVSAIPTLTAATGYCPIYQLVGIDYTF